MQRPIIAIATLLITTCPLVFARDLPPNEGDHGESNLDCRAPIDVNAPLLWEYASKKQRLEKAVLSIKPWKGLPYTVEMPNATVESIGTADINAISINLSAASSRLTVRPTSQ